MNSKLALAAFAAVAVVASPASAQTALTGGRVEVLAGLDRVNADDFHDSGLAYAINVGYDFAAGGNVSLGFDLEAGDSTVTKKLRIGTVDTSIRAKRDLYAGARVNFGLDDKTIAYLKAGYSNARVSFGTIVAPNNELNGWRFGVGANRLIQGNVFLGGEYRYSNYEDGYARHQVLGSIGARF